MASEVEKEVLSIKGVKFANVFAKPNPITGQHTELVVEGTNNHELQKEQIKKYLSEKLPKHMVPSRISIRKIDYNHRFKKEGLKHET